jgi:crossover junction endodeoxyribonuclease RuvC
MPARQERPAGRLTSTREGSRNRSGRRSVRLRDRPGRRRPHPGRRPRLVADPCPRPPEVRLKRIHDAVADLIAKQEPDSVALEESYVGADARTALSVGQARGAVLVACAKAGMACTEYPPATVKNSVCGYGRAEKAQVQRMVRAILGLAEVPTPHHAADALAVAICHALAPPLTKVAGAAR